MFKRPLNIGPCFREMLLTPLMAGGGPSYHYKFSLPVAQLSISPALASDTRLELTSTANNQTDVYILEVRGDLL